MMHKKNNIVVGLTTFDNEMLRISVPAIGRMHQKVTLIIFNDNPTATITRRQIRKLGYSGDLQIINSDENLGEFRARMAIVDAARDLKPDWFIFCDDDDMLIDAEIPNVSDDNFAIIQNAVVLRHRVVDLLRAIDNPFDIDPDGENVVLMRPHLGMAGTPIRSDVLFELFDVCNTVFDAIKNLDNKLEFVPPVDAIMWNFINIYARHRNPNAVPIYMDKTNYIKCDIDTNRIKYGRVRRPVRNVAEQLHRVTEKYNAVLNAALAAAPRGLGK